MIEAGAYDPHALHGFAHDSIARGSKSFALASQLFDRETRERVWLLLRENMRRYVAGDKLLSVVDVKRGY